MTGKSTTAAKLVWTGLTIQVEKLSSTMLHNHRNGSTESLAVAFLLHKWCLVSSSLICLEWLLFLSLSPIFLWLSWPLPIAHSSRISTTSFAIFLLCPWGRVLFVPCFICRTVFVTLCFLVFLIAGLLRRVIFRFSGSLRLRQLDQEQVKLATVLPWCSASKLHEEFVLTGCSSAAVGLEQ